LPALVACPGGARSKTTVSATATTPPPPGPRAAIDEPAAHASVRTNPRPGVSPGQRTDSIEATQCSLRRCEACLLADCWQDLDLWPLLCEGARPPRGTLGRFRTLPDDAISGHTQDQRAAPSRECSDAGCR
jgi:hypothetical protein